jgi:condensin complex subunit 3
MEAKDKNIRFRVTLLTVSMVNGLGEIKYVLYLGTILTDSEDLYILLRKSLLARAADKEAAVRVQAALGLAKLSSGEDVDDLEEGQVPLQKVLISLLRHDPAA